jgi:hypothetical protein
MTLFPNNSANTSHKELSSTSVRKGGGVADHLRDDLRTSIVLHKHADQAYIYANEGIDSGLRQGCTLLARCIAGEYRMGTMRCTNPVGRLRTRLTTSPATPSRSGFGYCFTSSINRSHSHRSANTANAAKIGQLKSPDARSALSLFCMLPASSIRLKRGTQEPLCAVWEGIVCQRASSQGMSGTVPGSRHK